MADVIPTRAIPTGIAIAIIGTAGRSNQPLSAALYARAFALLQQHIWSYSIPVHLVSGGAAWCDHLAVSLMRSECISSLTLEIPCNFVNGRYDNSYCGQAANRYHTKFSQVANFDSLRELSEVMQLENCRVCVSAGFHARNQKIALTPLLIALTFGESSPAAGGTLDTWELHKRAHPYGTRYHINLAAI